MDTHLIIEQVDAYLTLLHQAREILLQDGKRQSAAKVTSRKGGERLRLRSVQASSDRSAGDINRTSQTSVARFEPSKRRTVGVTKSKAQLTSNKQAESAATMSSAETTGDEIVKRVPAQRRTTFKRFAPSQRIKQESPKPTTALSHPTRSIVVVSSAEQLRLERERSVKPAVARPRSTGAGGTGRQAFEALFGQ